MSFASLYAAISGLSSFTRAMTVIGNNISNVNTVGFKASRISFGELLNQNFAGVVGRYQIGRGVRVSTVQRIFDQGSFMSTNSVTDLAIDGNGFFVVSDGISNYYTRAGQFVLSKEGKLMNNLGYVVQGYELNAEEDIIQNILTDIDLSNVITDPKATSEVEVFVNLNSEEEAVAAPFDPDDPSTFHFTTTATVYDSQGNEHYITFFFTKVGDNTWDWNTTVDGSYAPTNPNGTLTFTTEGRLDTETPATFTLNFGGGVGAQDITFDFGDSITTDGGDGTGTTQFAGLSETDDVNQDGYAAGKLMNIQISPDGKIRGLFTNGQYKNLYQIALARFRSPWGLLSIGGNLFEESEQSGEPLIGVSGTSGLGRVFSNSLEFSNVDLAREFVEMIRTQQAFQANSRVITTTDQLLQEVINLKR